MIKAGQKLEEERLKKGLSLDKVAKATKIRAEFLAAIEKGDYQKIPLGAYAQGFVRNYAEFLGLPTREVLALFRREYDQERVFKVLPEGLSVSSSDFPVHKLKLRQLPVIIIVVFVLLLGYIGFQYRYAVFSPPLDIYLPKENSVTTFRTVTISGKTDPNATLFTNDLPVSIGSDGTFKKSIDVFPGKNTITIKVLNRFGKETVVIRNVEVK